MKQLKHLNTVVVRVCDKQAVFMIHKKAGGQVELTGLAARPPEEHQEISRQIEHLDVVKCRVRHKNMAGPIHGKSLGPRKIAGRITWLANSAQQNTLRILDLNGKEYCVENQNFIIGSQSNIQRFSET